MKLKRYEIHIYDDVCVDLFNNGVLDKSINNTYKLEDLLNQQDKRIKELQQQLAENNEFFNAFACKDFNEFKDFISTFMLAPHEEQTLIRELKQQLAEIEKKNFELVAKINLKEHKPAFCTLADRDCEALGKIAELQKQLVEKDKEIEYQESMKILAVENQNKKAIEQLEKVKGLIANHTQELWTCENDDIDVVLYEEIDKQINGLKGKVEDEKRN